MANTIAKITGYIVKEAARGLYNTRLFSGLIKHAYNDEFATEGAKKGETIFVKKPAKFRVRSGATQEIQDVVQTKIPVTLPAQTGVDFTFSSRELTLDIDNGTKSFSEQTVVPAGSALASNKDAEGLQTMRVLARNMAQLLKAGVGPRLAPEPEEREWTHFIR